MPLLGGLLLTLFTGLVDFFATVFAREFAVRLAFGALIVAAWVTLYALLAALLAGVAYSMPAGLVTVLEFLLPGNVTGCAAAVIATDAAISGFRLYVSGIKV